MKRLKPILNFSLDLQLNFEKKLFPEILSPGKYKNMDFCIRKAVNFLHHLNIRTNSSEGGGGKSHGAPDYIYIEAGLSRRNLLICLNAGFILDKIRSGAGQQLLFNGSAWKYGKATGYFVIGVKRGQLKEKEVREKFMKLIRSLKYQYQQYQIKRASQLTF